MQDKNPIQKENDVILYLNVKAGAFKSEIVGFENGELKVRLRAIREKGKANSALIELLADSFSKSKSEIEIISGLTACHKKVIVYNAQIDDIVKICQN